MARTPFDTLQQLRRQEVDEAAHTLAARRAQTEAAARDVQQARRDLERERAQRQAAGQAEAERAADGELRVVDLQRLLGFEHASRGREQVLEGRGQRARQALEAAVVRDERAEQELLRTRAESLAVDNVQRKRAEQQQREQELKGEEEASETWQSSKH